MSVRERDYGSVEVIETSLFDITGAGFSTVALVAGDAKVSKDGGTFVAVANLPTNVNGQVRWTPGAGELAAKTIAFRIEDQDSPPQFLVREMIIETRAHASAMHPNLGLAPPTATAIRNAILSWEPFPGYSLARMFRVFGIVLRGTATGMETTTPTFTAPAGGATVSVTGADEHGNRGTVTDTASNDP